MTRSNKGPISETLGQKIVRVLLGYFKTQFVLMFITGFAAWGILTLLKVKFALALAITTGVLSGIPNFGIIFASLAVVMVVIFDKVHIWRDSSVILEALLVLAIFVILNKVIDLFLAPILLSKATKVNPLLVFLLVLVGTALFGIWGALFMVPVFLVIKTIIEHFSARS